LNLKIVSDVIILIDFTKKINADIAQEDIPLIATLSISFMVVFPLCRIFRHCEAVLYRGNPGI